MAKKKALTMWALWNYGTLRDVGYYRKTVREAANKTVQGGKAEADKWFRSGAFRIGKVSVREIPNA